MLWLTDAFKRCYTHEHVRQRNRDERSNRPEKKMNCCRTKDDVGERVADEVADKADVEDRRGFVLGVSCATRRR